MAFKENWTVPSLKCGLKPGPLFATFSVTNILSVKYTYGFSVSLGSQVWTSICWKFGKIDS